MDIGEEEEIEHWAGAVRDLATGAHQFFLAFGKGFAEEGVSRMGEHGFGEVMEGVPRWDWELAHWVASAHHWQSEETRLREKSWN